VRKRSFSMRRKLGRCSRGKVNDAGAKNLLTSQGEDEVFRCGE
jgi:hypothetical protein